MQKGDIVVDATMGNGNDTVFLAQLVGDIGKVYSFDIQQVAIEITMKKLLDLYLIHRVTLIKTGHENMGFHVDERIKAVMFNLGYLPGGDHNIHTKSISTINALITAMSLICVNGIISIVVYHGGDSGFEEKDDILSFVCKLSPKQFSVTKTEFLNQPNCLPF